MGCLSPARIDNGMMYYERGAEEVQLRRSEFILGVPMRKNKIRVRLPVRVI